MTPIQTALVSWQFEQLPVTPLWIWVVVGAGVAKRVPGGLVVALDGSNPTGRLPMWHDSQVVPDGMCEVGPTGAVGGITTRLVMPANVAPVTVGPWQVAQPLLMPL